MSDTTQDPRRPPGLPDEAELLREARRLLPPVDAEPRPGFAARVAAQAAGQRARPLGAPWWRFAFGGGALAAGAAALVLALSPKHPGPAPQALAMNDARALAAAGSELAVAQRLELYEELTLAQNADALEEMDVVAELDQLEAKP